MEYSAVDCKWFGVADGEGKGLDSGLFGFTPETAEETFQRMYK